MTTISLAPEATCSGVPHTCGLTMPFTPETPQSRAWADSHGSELVEFFEWLDSEDLVNDEKQVRRYGFDAHKLVAAYLEVDNDARNREQNGLWDSMVEAGHYAEVHGIMGLAGSYRPRACPSCGAIWDDGHGGWNAVEEECEACGARFDLLHGKMSAPA